MPYDITLSQWFKLSLNCLYVARNQWDFFFEPVRTQSLAYLLFRIQWPRRRVGTGV